MVDTSSAFWSVRPTVRAPVHLSYLARLDHGRFGMCLQSAEAAALSAISQSTAIRNGHAALTWALTRRSEPHKDIHCIAACVHRLQAAVLSRRMFGWWSPRTTSQRNILKEFVC